MNSKWETSYEGTVCILWIDHVSYIELCRDIPPKFLQQDYLMFHGILSTDNYNLFEKEYWMSMEKAKIAIVEDAKAYFRDSMHPKIRRLRLMEAKDTCQYRKNGYSV